MPIYDFNGTTKQEIGKIYDFNGTANSQIGKVYDNNGSANSLIYTGVSPSNPQILVNGVAAQPDVTGSIVTKNDGGGGWYLLGYTTSQGGSRGMINHAGKRSVVLYFATPLDISGYSKLCCQIYGKKGYGDATKGRCWLGFGFLDSITTSDGDGADWAWPYTSWSKELGDVGTVTYSIDLSENLTGVYCGVAFKTTEAVTYSLYIKNIWLEE